MYGNDKVISAIVYGFYWAILLYLYFRLVWKRRFALQWAAARSGRSGERGQGLVEYALILVLVAVVVIGILLILGPAIRQLF